MSNVNRHKDLNECTLTKGKLVRYRLVIEAPDKNYYLYKHGNNCFLANEYLGMSIDVDTKTKTFYKLV